MDLASSYSITRGNPGMGLPLFLLYIERFIRNIGITKTAGCQGITLGNRLFFYSVYGIIPYR